MKQRYPVKNTLPSTSRLNFPHAGAVTLAHGETKTLQLDDADAKALRNTHGFEVSAPVKPKARRVPGANAPRAEAAKTEPHKTKTAKAEKGT